MGFSVSVGRWHRRALPTRKSPQGKGEVCLLQPKALHGTAKGCAPARRWAGAVTGRRRCSALARDVFHLGVHSSSSPASPLCVPPCSLPASPRAC